MTAESKLLSRTLDEFLFEHPTPTPGDFFALIGEHQEWAQDIAEFGMTWFFTNHGTEAESRPADAQDHRRGVIEHADRIQPEGVSSTPPTAQAAATHRAIGWMRTDGTLHKGCPPFNEPEGWEAVFTRGPLTDEQIDRIYDRDEFDTLDGTGFTLRQFARAIEAEHGIGPSGHAAATSTWALVVEPNPATEKKESTK